MDDAEYCATILCAYEGEIGGAITSTVLMSHLKLDATQRTKLDLLRRLETGVGAALAPIVQRLGANIANLEQLREKARDRALAVDSWEELIRHFGPPLQRYVAHFKLLAGEARLPDGPALALLVSHEEALVGFGRLESAGDQAGALALLRRAVRNVELFVSTAREVEQP